MGLSGEHFMCMAWMTTQCVLQLLVHVEIVRFKNNTLQKRVALLYVLTERQMDIVQQNKQRSMISYLLHKPLSHTLALGPLQ